MLWNKVYEESDLKDGLSAESNEINDLIDSLHSNGVPLTVHRIRYWEWPLNLHVAEVKEGDRVLDIGVGGSPLLVAFKNRGCECYGCDKDNLNPIYEKHLSNLGINFLSANIFNLPFEDNYFDFVTSTCVLEHIDNLKIEDRQPFLNSIVKGLTETIRVLKPGTLSSHTIDFKIFGFNGWSQFNKYDISKIVNNLKGLAKQAGGVNYEVADGREYYLRENPIHSPNSEKAKITRACLENKMRLADGSMRTCASLVLRKGV